jgi:S1-C subfamily serine protease
MDTTTPQTPAPALTPPAVVERPRSTWRSVVAGSLAGGLLAASVAVPLTWRYAGVEDTTSATSAVSGTTTATTEVEPPTTQTLPEWGGGTGGIQGFATGGQSSSTATETDATDAQSTGVVLIETVTPSGEAAGTGLVLDSSGVVVTNYHVVEGATAVTVTVATTGETYQAEVLGSDQEADVAVLQLDDASGLDVVDLDDDGAALDEAVTAVGNAEGQGYLSASTGTVTGLEESITTSSEGLVEGEDLEGLIETDAYVVGGYSGGALLDAEGEVVGITTAASSSTAAVESYAVPIDDALAVVEEVEAGDESGSVRIGPAAYLGVAVDEGLQVASVETGSAAAAAGIGAGATLLALDGTSVGSLDALSGVLDGLEPGDRVAIRWADADGTTHRASVTLGSSAAA